MPSNVTGVIQDLERVLLSPEQIAARVAEMAARLNVELAGRVVTVVALMDGGLFFVADLLRKLEMPVRLHTLSASSYQGGTATTGEVKVNWPATLNLHGQDVLLLDDILDTGLTLGAITERILEQEPASLRTCVLLSKRRPRLREVVADAGFEIDDEFVVGYGMDFRGRFRNLPCIGILNLDPAS
ncbi:phosphoribosyltransferase [Prosthecobacter vanneervenii]|uniref:Hypoxanthine phosphoribosyltransferase n=1 Tax=Prosthecobacter vanneervenii TaxID=48466 RepID=A0A7W7YB47_9BACT|nr:phosphoribosyltransferase family protein [Prosthecobacter vanneervenii]MBB5032595.1 hypoxanthine phosphoribosyltransferase [Prosthecobacter vanneervenii]